MRTNRFLITGLTILILAIAATTYIARYGWIQDGSVQISVQTLPCTSDWRACQHSALGYLSQAIKKYPRRQEYTVSWSRTWLPTDGTDRFEIIYNRKSRDLVENNIGTAQMDCCRQVTDQAINAVACTSGGFDALTHHGADYKPL